MRLHIFAAVVITAITIQLTSPQWAQSNTDELLKTHCAKCHSGDEPEGDFSISSLGIKNENPERESREITVSATPTVRLFSAP